MKNAKSVVLILTGAVIGASLTPAASAAMEYIQAQRTARPIYVDGQQVQLEAYAIGGNNYVKLREIGEAVGFEVYWDGSAAQILSDKPYTGGDSAKELATVATDYSQQASPGIFTDTLSRAHPRLHRQPRQS